MDTLAFFIGWSGCRPRHLNLVALAAMVAFCQINAPAAGTNNVPPAKVPTANAPLVLPKSVFVDDLTKGKDPFFPGTARRVDKTAVAAAALAASASMPTKPTVELIQLKGLFNSTNRRLALINNRTFETGEQAEVKTTDGKVRLRCLEIRPRSVIILLPGETQRRELHLNEKL